jgi:hypothetical protein
MLSGVMCYSRNHQDIKPNPDLKLARCLEPIRNEWARETIQIRF